MFSAKIDTEQYLFGSLMYDMAKIYKCGPFRKTWCEMTPRERKKHEKEREQEQNGI